MEGSVYLEAIGSWDGVSIDSNDDDFDDDDSSCAYTPSLGEAVASRNPIISERSPRPMAAGLLCMCSRHAPKHSRLGNVFQRVEEVSSVLSCTADGHRPTAVASSYVMYRAT